MISISRKDPLLIITSSTANVDYTVTYAFTTAEGTISSIGTKSIKPIQDNSTVSYISVANTHQYNSNTITISTQRAELFKAELQAGERLIFYGNLWETYDSSGVVKSAQQTMVDHLSRIETTLSILDERRLQEEQLLKEHEISMRTMFINERHTPHSRGHELR